jgi:hypothetical protein
MITESALGRPEGKMMLDAVPLEDLDLAGIEPDRERDGDEALRELGPLAQRLGEVEEIGDGIELVAGHLVGGILEEVFHERR